MTVKTSGQLAPCCEFSGEVGNLSNGTIQDAWNSDKLQEVRRRFAKGQKVKECWKCYDREAHEGNSMRIEMNENFSSWREHLEECGDILSAAPPHPVALDLRISNICNFKCRNCHHQASSKWYSDSKELGLKVGTTAEIRSFSSVDDLITQLGMGLDCLEEIYFAGGEPLLQEEHYALLQLLCDRNLTHVRLRYNSNLSLTRFRGQSIFNFWERFPSLQVEASVDAAGERGAFLRSGFDWQVFVSNVNELKRKCPKAEVRFGVTVSSVNIQSLPELLQSLHDACDATPEQLRFHSLQTPRHYRTQILPFVLKRRAAQNIDEYMAKLAGTGSCDSKTLEVLQCELQGLVNYMYAADLSEEVPKFLSLTKRLDDLRSESMKEIFPELALLFEPLPQWRVYFFAAKRWARRGMDKIRQQIGLYAPNW